MLRADESALQPGHSWITNFDFDRDGSFSTNKRNWESLSDYVSGAARTSGWQIRPTIYTALIEFMEVDGSKSLILLYHVYHAKQTNGIHDWERIEIRVNNVNGVTGSGTERVRYAAITRHYDHPVRLYGSSDLNFQETPTGRHVMIWQAQGSNPLNAGAELVHALAARDPRAARVASPRREERAVVRQGLGDHMAVEVALIELAQIVDDRRLAAALAEGRGGLEGAALR